MTAVRRGRTITQDRVDAGATYLLTLCSIRYILRPEALEAFWYMYALTGDKKYREWGWKIFQKFEQVGRRTDAARMNA